MFGGSDRTGVLSETWTWDGKTWRRQHPAVSPPAREYALSAYDPAGKQVVVFGGETCPPPGPDDLIGCGKDYKTVADTWAWDGSTWSQVHTTHVPEVPIAGETSAGMATDRAHGRLMLVTAGKPDPDFRVQTWALANGDWQRLHPRHPPAAYEFTGPAFDSISGRLLLQQAAPPHYMCNQNGCPNRPALLYDTTWSWDGTDWHDLGLAARSPHDYGHLLPMGPAGVFMIAEGGQYEWTGSSWNSGQELPPAIFGDVAQRIDWMAAYYEPSHQVVVTGGRAFETNHLYGDTVGWDGIRWATLVRAPILSAPVPLPPCSPAKAYAEMVEGPSTIVVQFAEPPAGPCQMHVNVVVTLVDSTGVVPMGNNPATQPVNGDLTWAGGGQAVTFVFEGVCQLNNPVTWNLQAGDLQLSGLAGGPCPPTIPPRITSSAEATPPQI
jgi:hypothetical protein